MLRPVNVLVCDDDEDVASLLTIQLRKAGFIIFTAFDGLQAVKHIFVEKPDIVLMDWMMPDMDGLETCKVIRRQDSQVYIMMLSAIDSEERRADALNAGANDYQIKPVAIKNLIELINKALRIIS